MKSKVKKRNYGLWLLCCSLWMLLSLRVSDWERVQGGETSPVTAAEKPKDNLRLSLKGGIPTQSVGTRKNLTPSSSRLVERGVAGGVKSVCSDQDIETLTTQLLRDLPTYANRAIQRARPPLLSKRPDLYSYMLVAGEPEFTPLGLKPDGYSTDTLKTTDKEIKQVFFTTLERQYIQGKAVELQQFHRLFLTKTKIGWRVVMMFSEIGHYPAKTPPTPPRDSSNGDVAQGINAWLRDCQAGSVRVRPAKLGG
ncbi:MAG: hypothetical protein DSM106950_20095 [Stigonema ocellatum SAG 48.90 = DSM 106950]|nr:hypothetical protein [Stigonema ocellatum SAG 48.90 = DSM 106950]